ncbi:hypothetical protein LUZ63_023244 [Rhynchospora breviuscula]|uniref:Galactofuranosyltransferase-2 C-terminal domain-containing protein n=1 Tax=Rhynchospora breviuscula TaxID=2022672 RepID=A0A9P9Z3A2_9POAL|nr:hypothetical protein LUZ63_023244 [Rhynchospora breviuscula]
MFEGAEWTTEQESVRAGKASIGITTYNKPDYCVATLNALADAPDALEVIDRVFLIDQGTDLVEDRAEYSEVAARLGETLRVVRQPNLGGSGGFARAMVETLQRPESDFVQLLDDDVRIEPESVRRSVVFGRYASVPTIVGAHMFDLLDRPKLHAWAEVIDDAPFMWRALFQERLPHDFSVANLRQTPTLHMRLDADYNGWWMLPHPHQHPARDRSLAPGVHQVGRRRVLHPGPGCRLPDGLDARRRAVARLLGRQGRLDRLAGVLPCAQPHRRSAAALAVARGRHPHPSQPPRRPEAPDDDAVLPRGAAPPRAARHPLRSRPHAGDPLARHARGPPDRAEAPRDPDPQGLGRPATVPSRAPGVSSSEEERVRQPDGSGAAHLHDPHADRALAARPRPENLAQPEVEFGKSDAHWWRVPLYDSALVSAADGSGKNIYTRDRAQFRRMLIDSVRLHRKLQREWPRLSHQYREALPDLVSEAQWRATFEEQA